MGTIPAASLEGKDLGNGWKVIKQIPRSPQGTGGNCSFGYIVKETATGKQAFLKAIDFSKAVQDKDPTRAIQTLTELYNFERYLSEKCKDLSRVVTAILHGNIYIGGYGNLGLVPYLIFEEASGDIRKVQGNFEKVDLLWRLQSLHDVAVGLRQLHGKQVVHQDLKPSNVLVIGKEGSKISDLGSASDQTKESPNDSMPIPGARSYAPVEVWYSDTGIEGFEKKLLADLYLFGSLFYFHFAGISALQALRGKVREEELAGRSFKHILPYLQHAFEATLIDLQTEVEKSAGQLTPEIMEMVRQLCEPDPTKRGDPNWRGSMVPTYNLQRYETKLDVLAKKVMIGLR